MAPERPTLDARAGRSGGVAAARLPQPICWLSAALSARAGPSTGSSPSGLFLNTVNSPLPSSDGPDVQRPCGASEPSTPVS